MIWDGDACTGVPRQLYRVFSKLKDGLPNLNYARFFCAIEEPKLDEAGEPVKNANGFPATNMRDFKWFDQCDLVRSGAFQTTQRLHARTG